MISHIFLRLGPNWKIPSEINPPLLSQFQNPLSPYKVNKDHAIPWPMDNAISLLFLLWRWNEAKQKVVKLGYCFHFTSMPLKPAAEHRSTETFFICSTTLILLYTSSIYLVYYKLKGGWPLWYFLRKMDFFYPDSHGTISLRLFHYFPFSAWRT